jgi:hypothetical protein
MMITINKIISLEVAAPCVLFLCLLIELYGHLVEVLRLNHQFVKLLSLFEQICQVFVDDVLDLVKLFLYLEQLISLVRVLPLLQEHLQTVVLEGDVGGSVLVDLGIR